MEIYFFLLDPRLHENLEVTAEAAKLDHLQLHYLELIRQRVKNSGDSTLKVHRDATYTENPMERENVEETVKVHKKDLFVQTTEDL